MKKIYHICKLCSKEFHGCSTRKYCSRDCHHKDRPSSWNKGITGLKANRPKEGHTQSCKQCNKEFYIQKSRYRKENAKFCSTKCYSENKWHSLGSCVNCGIKSDKRYCSEKCKNEQINYSKKLSYWKRKQVILEKLGSKCLNCGVDDIRVLDIDHIDPNKKEKPPKREYTWSRRIKEWEKNLDNLRILCSNCHRIHTWHQRGFGIEGFTH